MEAPEALRSIVSALSGLSPGEIHAGLALDQIKLRGSIKRARLDAELRKRFQRSFPNVYTAKTYAELETAVLGAPSAPVPFPAPSAPAATAKPSAPQATSSSGWPAGDAPLACGIDLEMVENLPAVLDYWEDAFYTTHFTPSEIAWCSLQPEPRLHFTVRWAAKEALKKCDSTFMLAETGNLELKPGENGEFHLVRLAATGREILPHAVLVSQTDAFAASVVTRLPADADRASLLAEMAAKLAATLPVPE